jgi:hypothetical protein
MLAMADTFWILAILFLAMIPLTFLLQKTAQHEGPVMME